jgi:hypothetical protein
MATSVTFTKLSNGIEVEETYKDGIVKTFHSYINIKFIEIKELEVEDNRISFELNLFTNSMYRSYSENVEKGSNLHGNMFHKYNNIYELVRSKI